MLLNGTRRTIFVECTLRDAWENFNHRVRTVLLIHVGKAYDIGAISEKTSAKELVDHDDVDNLQISIRVSLLLCKS